MYRILSCIDSPYGPTGAPNPTTLAEAISLAARVAATPMVPFIPKTTAGGEDETTLRIPVAPTIEDCVSGIGVDAVFKRCIAPNQGLRTYAINGNEVYPFILVKFPDDAEAVKPTTGQVPDQLYTNEMWLMEPTKPLWAELLWLRMNSIEVTACPSIISPWLATSVTAYLLDELPETAVHPWLTGTGHIMSSSETEYVPTRQCPEWAADRPGDAIRTLVTMLTNELTKSGEFSDPKDAEDYIFSCVKLTKSDCHWLYQSRAGHTPYYGSAVDGFPVKEPN